MTWTTPIVSLPVALLASVLFAQEPTLARPLAEDRETAWSAYIAQEWHGEAEHQCPDGSRVDVLTDTTAYEVEWPEKWAQSIGQAVFYRAATNRKGGVVLLMGRQPKKVELVYYLRCLTACRECGLELLVENVAPEAER